MMDYKFMWQELRDHLRKDEAKYDIRAREDLSKSDIRNYKFHSGLRWGATGALVAMHSLEKEATDEG